MEVYGSRYVKVRITTATEHHHNVGKLTRLRVQPLMSHFCRALLIASGILAALLLLQTYLWPFNRTAVLIPLAWWTMYLLNRWKVTTPVLGMVDLVAERAGYYPVPAKKPRKASCEQPVPQPLAEQDRRDEDKVEVPEEAVENVARAEDLSDEEVEPAVR
jgi:hypothetical protein